MPESQGAGDLTIYIISEVIGATVKSRTIFVEAKRNCNSNKNTNNILRGWWWQINFGFKWLDLTKISLLQTLCRQAYTALLVPADTREIVINCSVQFVHVYFTLII